MPSEGRLPAVEETLTIDALPEVPEGRQRRPDRPHEAHQVELPVGVPFLVGDVLEACVTRDARVVDEDVEAAEGADGILDRALRLPWLRQVAPDVQALADPGRLASPAGDDPRAFGNELSCHLEPDPAGRPGDETGAVGEVQLHDG